MKRRIKNSQTFSNVKLVADDGLIEWFNQLLVSIFRKWPMPLLHVITDFVSFVTAFLLKNPSLTHAVVPPFRNRSRSSRLFGCKRPHDGFVSLPPCFGWGGTSKFDLCLFTWLLYSNRLFSSIRLAASSIASQWYTAFSRVILPCGS